MPPMGLGPAFLGPGGVPTTVPMVGPMSRPPGSSLPPGQPMPPMGGVTQAPTKPLFPAAVPQTSTTVSQVPVGTDFKPLTSSASVRPTFPAYSPATNSPGQVESSSASPLTTSEAKKPSLIATTSASSKIIHPEEDISLEEIRAKLPRYQGAMGSAAAVPMMPGKVMQVTSGTIPPTANPVMMNGMNMMRPPMGIPPGIPPGAPIPRLTAHYPGPSAVFPPGPSPMMPHMMTQGAPRPF